MPGFVPMETQVLSGILPISNVSAIPSCIHYASSLLPLERIFKLTHPLLTTPLPEDKRTWRHGVPSHVKEKSVQWTAMDILTAYADKKGWVTAKAGRSDIMRAGNALLRALADGKVSWGFWPPGTEHERIKAEGDGYDGIWITREDLEEVDEDSEAESEIEDDVDETATTEDGDSVEDDEEDEDEDEVPGLNAGRFGALSIEEA
jgi:hypothetical protein